MQALAIAEICVVNCLFKSVWRFQNVCKTTLTSILLRAYQVVQELVLIVEDTFRGTAYSRTIFAPNFLII